MTSFQYFRLYNFLALICMKQIVITSIITKEFKLFKQKLTLQKKFCNMPYEKSLEEYRRDIFSLKNKLKQEQKYLEEIKQKYLDVDIIGEDKSYSFNIKLKILEYNLTAIKENMDKYQKDQAFEFYAINFATLALIKSSEIFMINREMIFRAVDIKSQGKISSLDLAHFFKESLKLNEEFIQSIVRILDIQNTGMISRQRYYKYLECFLINSQQQNRQITTVDLAGQNIARQIIFQRNANPKLDLRPETIWKIPELNIAIFCRGLTRKINNIDSLDCIGLYCMLDPTKKGYIETKNAVTYLNKRMNDVKNFYQGNVKLQK